MHQRAIRKHLTVWPQDGGDIEADIHRVILRRQGRMPPQEPSQAGPIDLPARQAFVQTGPLMSKHGRVHQRDGPTIRRRYQGTQQGTQDGTFLAKTGTRIGAKGP